MHYIRRHHQRGHANFGWLDSRHSFSFGQYYDPAHMGFSNLRVINDDRVAPGAGFDTHGHRDMEIISYITSGTIEHKDSMGHGYLIPAGDVQLMSAGSGVTHSEYNHHTDRELTFLQIWIEPNRTGIAPNYQQMAVTTHGELTPLATPDGVDGSLTIQADASLYRIDLEPEQRVTIERQGRSGYVHLLQGELEATSTQGVVTLSSGDGAGSQDISKVELKATHQAAQALWFDLAPIHSA